jgi:hypothetical protein
LKGILEWSSSPFATANQKKVLVSEAHDIQTLLCLLTQVVTFVARHSLEIRYCELCHLRRFDTVV